MIWVDLLVLEMLMDTNKVKNRRFLVEEPALEAKFVKVTHWDLARLFQQGPEMRVHKIVLALYRPRNSVS
jgi:hypothetical protein